MTTAGWLLDTGVISELRPPRPPDLIIAATASHHGLTVLTRDTGDFARAGVALLDRWRAR